MRDLAEEGIESHRRRLSREVDARYVGQSHDLTLTSDEDGFTREEVDRLVAEFHREHERVYGFSAPDNAVEFVTVRVVAVGAITKPSLKRVGEMHDGHQPEPRAVRPVYFAEAGGSVDALVYDRYALQAGAVVRGPAIVEEFDSTTVIHPMYMATTDQYGNLMLTAISEADRA